MERGFNTLKLFSLRRLAREGGRGAVSPYFASGTTFKRQALSGFK
jgi:hypothetical protein